MVQCELADRGGAAEPFQASDVIARAYVHITRHKTAKATTI